MRKHPSQGSGDGDGLVMNREWLWTIAHTGRLLTGRARSWTHAPFTALPFTAFTEPVMVPWPAKMASSDKRPQQSPPSLTQMTGGGATKRPLLWPPRRAQEEFSAPPDPQAPQGPLP
ncbi:hypothetical protein VTJ04DRAFT_8753 [Mycothermus thermophilus]|uniref:uncharacterized protein n=1 Tax=Humicola insolens TaxID=85995 RepID=UPI003744927D